MDLVGAICHWRARLGGRPDSELRDQRPEDLLREAGVWHARRIIAEQMSLLTLAQAMEQHGLKSRDLAIYYGNSEARSSPLGRLNFVSGIGELSGLILRTVLPVLRCGAYRPFMRFSTHADTASAMLSLDKAGLFTKTGWEPGAVMDALYQKSLSPAVARKILSNLVAFGKHDSSSQVALLQAVLQVQEPEAPLAEAEHSLAESAARLEPETE